MTAEEKKDVNDLIRSYASVYSKFEDLQKGDNSLLPGGDQKTGVIGEYYAKCYIENNLKCKAQYAKAGARHDIEYTKNDKVVRVQVKCVSAHSKTRTIAPLSLQDKDGNPSFDYLYLISLDDQFKVDAFYINQYHWVRPKINGDKQKVKKGSIMRGYTKEGKFKRGSGCYDFSNNLVDDMKKLGF